MNSMLKLISFERDRRDDDLARDFSSENAFRNPFNGYESLRHHRTYVIVNAIKPITGIIVPGRYAEGRQPGFLLAKRSSKRLIGLCLPNRVKDDLVTAKHSQFIRVGPREAPCAFFSLEHR